VGGTTALPAGALRLRSAERIQRLQPSPDRQRLEGSPTPWVIDVALLGVALMWASGFTLFKIAWREMDPIAFTGVRFAAMSLFAVGVVFLSRDRVRPRRADLAALALSGLTGYFLYQMGFVLGLDRTTALAGAILISTHPIFSIVVMWLTGRRRPARAEVAGVIVSFIGVAVFLRAWDAFGAARPGDLFSLGAAAAFGAYGVVNQRLASRFSPSDLMAYGLVLGGGLITLISVPAMLAQDWSEVTAPAWAILVYAIVGPVYLAYLLWNWAIKHRGVPRTVVYGFLVPIFGGVIAVVALDERLTPERVVGALIVVGGLFITRLGGE
jgi:drug/metabolite transporter (DMT)-like permease